MSDSSTYERLISLLDHAAAEYQIIDHPEEGRTDIVSAMRGNEVEEAAKCMILLVKIGKKTSRFILAVVPGDKRVDLDSIRRITGGTFIRFADRSLAEKLGGSLAGTILPFAFEPRLELIVDPAVAASHTMYFNAARLDRSLALKTEDYLRIARPRIESITR